MLFMTFMIMNLLEFKALGFVNYDYHVDCIYIEYNVCVF